MNIYEYYISPNEYETAEKNGIRRKQVDLRVRQYGWTKERAITQQTQQKVSRAHYLKKAKENGICYATFCNRVYREGWKFEEAATKPVRKVKDILEENNEKRRMIPEAIMDLAEQNGVPKSTLYGRIKRGVDMHTAATVRKLPRGGRQAENPFGARGKVGLGG